MKRYVIFAGVNGSGKSTLYKIQNNMQDMLRVNVDEIAAELGRWDDPAVVMKAGKQAVILLKSYLEQGISFNQETTLCGKSILRNIKRAKEQGYLIEMHYVGVDSAEIAKERVAHRVLHGGHGIPEEDIERRYVETFQNLKECMPYCDLLVLYDNSEQFRRFAIYKRNKLMRLSSKQPEWYKRNVELPENDGKSA